MLSPNIPENEKARLNSLKLTGLLDTLPEADYDDFTTAASLITSSKMATISLVDADRQWFKSRCGVGFQETSREISFCGHTINEVNGFMEIQDTLEDKRFFDNPFVTDDPRIRFYAGATINSPQGFPIGTLCVFDSKPKKLTDEQKKLLKILAHQVERLIKTRLINIELKKSKLKLDQKNQELQQFTYTISHDLKSPIYGINSLLQLIKDEHLEGMNQELKEMVEMLGESTTHLSEFVTNLVTFYSQKKSQSQKVQKIELRNAISDLKLMVDPTGEFEITLSFNGETIIVNEIVFDQIMINLLSNAIKYSGDSTKIEIICKEDAEFYYFEVKDYGLGIGKADQKKIFNLFTTLGQKDRNRKAGTGVGLATVKKLVKTQSGKISVESKLGVGSTFKFSIKKQTKE
jgi:signal transduction histidine kinase